MDRRNFLQNSMGGFGSLALAGLLAGENSASDLTSNDGQGNSLGHHLPRAKSIIYLYMEGGPSQVDLFDYKPLLKKHAGKPLPFKTPATVFNSSNRVFDSPFGFRQHGDSGTWVSELFPNIAACSDDLTFVHSMHHGVSNHSAACYLSHTGDPIAGRPSLGSWMSYGLGSENQELPSFAVLDCGQLPAGGATTWSSGFLPATHQGVQFLRGKTGIEFLRSLDASAKVSKSKLEAILDLHRQSAVASSHPYLDSVISNYEKAARMQLSVPELLQIDDETSTTRKAFGLDHPATALFGSRCLLARRLVERGVRFVEIFSPRVKADRWDQHSNLKQGITNNSMAVDQPIAALIRDLKERGLLDETIVLWGGEFGRTPSSQGTGRDHNPFGYTVFLAGGGFRPGYHHGATDDFGYFAERQKVHLHDLHATILHQMGVDHRQLTYRFDGRDYRLTDVHGKLVKELVT